MLEQIRIIASKDAEPISEVAKETTIKDAGETALQASMETIENTSLESLKAQNELDLEKLKLEKIEQIKKNREDGANRENAAHKELQGEFSEEEGYKIEREQYLRDKDGNIVKDPETSEARRIDFTVFRDGQIVKNIEITSETAHKDAQIAKEERIRDVGGNFIKDRDSGQLFEIPKNIQTEVRRYA